MKIDGEQTNKRKATYSNYFLNDINLQKELYALIEPFYPKPGKGRPPSGLERMLRIHFPQGCFHSARIAAEEAL